MLFTDLVGSTEIRSRLGEEAAEALRRRHDDFVAGGVDENHGQLVKNLGDGVMATFVGASDAVRAAVAIQQALERHNRSGASGMFLEVRIGISAGDVTFEGADCFGTPVIEAARLCAASAGGQILVTDVVRLLAGTSCESEFRPVGPLELKGLPAAVSAYEVAWEPSAVSSVPLPMLLTDIGRIFVGRERNLERLGQLWKEALAGEKRVALLAGEPGVGKTRLAAAVAADAYDQGAMVLAGRCDEDLGVPYQPFVEALRQFVDFTSDGDLRRRLGRYGGELVRLVPELDQRVPGLAAPLRSDPETERYRLFDAVAAWLAAVSADEPVVVVLDDLQWAAKPTLLLCRHVVQSTQAARLLIVGTYRDTELSDDHPLTELLADLRRQTGVERHSLSGLDPAGVVSFMEQAAGRDLDDDDRALAQAVYAETEGNPFFVRELLRHLAESGAIERRDGRWVTGLPVEELGIPEGVRDVVGRRLSRLSAEANEALRVAAVLGPEFELVVLRRAVGLTEEALLSGLEDAISARLVTEVPSRTSRFRFAHALVRDTLYGEISGARRVAHHRRLAEAIETVHAGHLDDHLPALAHHWARAATPAADTERAVDYAARAGDRALTQLAHDEAAAYYRQGLELLDTFEVPANDARRMELLISLGEAQRRASNPAFRDTLLEAARLGRHRGDSDAVARAALANSRGTFSAIGVFDRDRVEALEAALNGLSESDDNRRARLLAILAVELIWSGDQVRRRTLSDEALVRARRLGDPGVLGSVTSLRWTTLWHPRFAGERRALADELLAIAEVAGDPSLRFWGLWRRSLACMELADVAGATENRDLAKRQADDLGQPFLSWCVNISQVPAAVAAGQLTEAERRVDQTPDWRIPDAEALFVAGLAAIRYEQGRLAELTRRLSDMVEQLPAVPLFRALLALAHCEADRIAEAQAIFAPLVRVDVDNLISDYFAAPTAAVLATVCAELNHVEEARTLAEAISPYRDQIASHPGLWFGSFSHHLGVLTMTLDRFSEAEDYFQAAEVAHLRIGATTWLARTRQEWARMLLARGQHGDAEQARELLGQALAAARDLSLRSVERQTVLLLERP